MASIHEEEFDVAIIGSGLGESITAAACARAGMRVLHVDQNDLYGTEEATLTFDQFMKAVGYPVDSQGHLVTSADEVRESSESKVDEVFPEGKLSISRIAASTNLSGYHLVKMHPLPQEKGTSSEDQSTTPSYELSTSEEEMGQAEGIDSEDQVQGPHEVFRILMKDSRNFGIDLSPRLLFCRGDMVDLLVQSGVSHYLEFKQLEAAFVGTISKSDELETVRVPCSKSEIFKTKDISMLEKRQLMKFFQYCMDTADESGEEGGLKWKNEKRLNQGRSLPRPQNKDLDKIEDDKELESNQSFRNFLKDTCKLSERLQQFVSYGVALLASDEDVTKETGMFRVQQYLQGLGRFGGTSFLCPMYGTSEIAQAFTRLCAIYGGVYQLRQREIGIVFSEIENAEDESTEQQEDVEPERREEDCATEQDEHESTADEEHSDPEPMRKVVGLSLAGEDVVKCKHIVAHADYLRNEEDSSNFVELRQIAVCSQPLIAVAPDDGNVNNESRALMVIPANSGDIGNKFAIHVLQLDAGVCVVPKSMFLVHLTTLCENSNDRSDSIERAKVLERALDHMLGEDKEVLQWSVNLEKPIESKDSDMVALCCNKIDTSPDSQGTEEVKLSNIQGIKTICSTFGSAILKGTSENTAVSTGMEVCMSDHVHRARELFNELCPGAEFLPESAASAQANAFEEDDLAMLATQHIRLPQVVDLTFFEWLGGKVSTPPPRSNL